MSNRSWKVKLRPISPIHIGDGDVLDPTEYIAKEGYVYYLNQITYVSHLLQKGISSLKQALDASNMEAIIQIMADNFDPGINLHWKSRTKVSDRFCSEWQRDLKDTHRSQQLHRFIRNRYTDDPYIPGSSLKGSIRTAVLNHLAKDEKKIELIENARRDRKFSGQQAEGILLDALNIHNTLDVSSDPFKYIKVTDAPLNEENLCIDQILRYGMSETELPVNYEMIKPESPETTFEISIDDRCQICDNVIKTINFFYKKLVINEWNWLKANLAEETRAFQTILAKENNAAKTEENKCIIRIGFGSGQWGMSLLNYWKENLKTKAFCNHQLLGWAILNFEEMK